MTKHLLTTSALALLTASPALADITAQGVWTDWQSYMKTFGYELSASESTSGDTLTVADAKMTFALPKDEGSVDVTLGTITFTNRSDGTVAVGLPETIPFTFKGSNGSNGSNESFAGTVNYTNTGLSIIISGTRTDYTYQYTAAALGMFLTDVIFDGKPTEIGTLEMFMTGLTGSANMKISNAHYFVQDFKISEMTYNVDIAPEGAEEGLKMVGRLSGLGFNGGGSYPFGAFDMSDMSGLLKAGFAYAGGLTYESGETSINVQDDNGRFNAQSSSNGGALNVAMNESELVYGGKMKDLKSVSNMPDLPFPIEINAAESAFDLKMPIAKSDATQPYRLNILLGDFTTSDMLWGMIDPGAQLPRDPATLHIDVSGEAKLAVDFLDPNQMEELGSDAPGEIHSTNIDTLKLSVAGAELNGKGGFTFDNSDMETMPGMPRPEGSVDLSLVGGNGLIDKLVGMGLLPEEQAMGARMMMGLFTVPGDGPDNLKSKIEITKEGQILANGQRLR